MIKKLFMATLVATALGAVVRPASAQSAGGNITTINGSANQGVFHVQLTKDTTIANTFDVFVNYVSNTAVNMHPNVDQIGITLNDGSGGGFNVVSSTVTSTHAAGTAGFTGTDALSPEYLFRLTGTNHCDKK